LWLIEKIKKSLLKGYKVLENGVKNIKLPKIHAPYIPSIPHISISIPTSKLKTLLKASTSKALILKTSILKIPLKIFTELKMFFLKFKLALIKQKPKRRIVKKKIKKKKHLRFNLSFISLILLIFIPLVLLAHILYSLPSPDNLLTRKVEVSTKIYDRNGILLFKIYKDKNRSIVKLEDVPLHVRLATLAAEDAEFYSHPGFSVKGITRAVIKNVSEGKLSGGSTITQQLVKNALLTSEKTLRRKIREIVLSVWTEMKFTKDEILEMYLNEVAYGGTAYGIQEASRTYFNKDVKDLDLAEAALIAGLPKSPTKYSPFGTNPELAFERQKEVLKLMKINGYITKEQEKRVLNEKITFAPNRIDIKAPHFVMFVRQELENLYGKEYVEKGGLNVTTTLDYHIQRMAEEVVKQEINKLKRLNVTNGAVVVLDAKTGEILAMVGSKNYFDIQNDGNVNVTTSLRQPGSSIKVINYAYALEHGYTPASIISDTPIKFLVRGQPPYVPRDYDGKYRGNISLRNAFAESRNIPAVRVLASYGVDKMTEMGKKMGITTWNNPSRYGLSLTLGGGEVKLLDLAHVYATIANYGRINPLKSLLLVINTKGVDITKGICLQNSGDNKSSKTSSQLETKDTYAKEECKDKQVVDPRVAYMLTDILKDNVARSPSFGLFSELVISGHPEVAVKTGTSNNLRDNLTIGYNQDYVVAVWVGNNDNSPMSRVASGVTGASPIFNKIMTMLLKDKESRVWNVPEGLIKTSICSLTGTLPCRGCPIKDEWFLKENVPQKACTFKSKEEAEKENGKEKKEITSITIKNPQIIDVSGKHRNVQVVE